MDSISENSKQIVYFVFTQYRWGKATTLTEALKNAEVQPKEQFIFQIWEAESLDDLGVTEYGGITYTDKCKKLFESDGKHPEQVDTAYDTIAMLREYVEDACKVNHQTGVKLDRAVDELEHNMYS